MTLDSVDNNKTHAAKLLGLSRRGLLKKLERYRANDEAELAASEDPDEEF